MKKDVTTEVTEKDLARTATLSLCPLWLVFISYCKTKFWEMRHGAS
jgi:hypothetical protein